MHWTDLTITIFGVLLCLITVGQFCFWTSHSVRIRRTNRQQLRNWQQAQRERLDRVRADRQAAVSAPNQPVQAWKGWRSFRVTSLRQETENCKSVFLAPVDDKPVPAFEAGQHLTVSITFPGTAKPHVRCYSLSNAPGDLPYRITVKHVKTNPQRAAGSVSEFLTQRLKVGDLIDVKAPSGEFVFQGNRGRPIVMLAAGVGITPLASMVAEISQSNGNLAIWLFYGSTCKREHVLRDELQTIAASNPNVTIVNCYSNPTKDRVTAQDFDVVGRIDIDVIRERLPSIDADYYLCGPAPFMQSLHAGLTAAGVSTQQIFHEAFGPASLARPKTLDSNRVVTESRTRSGKITFSISNKTVQCGDGKSILETAEEESIPMESGCRAGSCGTCAVRVLRGTVDYTDGAPQEIEAGFCLACVAHADGQVVVEA